MTFFFPFMLITSKCLEFWHSTIYSLLLSCGTNLHLGNLPKPFTWIWIFMLRLWGFFFKYSNFHCFAIMLLVSSCSVYIFSHPPEQNKPKKSNNALAFRPAYCSSHGVCASHSFFDKFFTAALCFMRFNSSWPVSCYFFHCLWFFFLCYFFPF